MTSSHALEVWRDEAHNRTVVKLYYCREKYGDIYHLSHAVANEFLATEEYASHYVARILVDQLRTKFYKGPWEVIEIAIIQALDKPETHWTYAPPREPAVDTYRKSAASEFEGVENLDESLWTGDGGLV